MKLLLADDNHFYRLALKANLTEWDYDVVEACDGKQAWDILKSPQSPKIAILDWLMPGLSGPELCKRLRALNKPEPTYIVILTSTEGNANHVEALRSGADDFIHKPFDRDQLHARLQVGRRIVSLQTSQTVIFTLARAAEAKNPYTKGHADRVTQYALNLAEYIGVNVADRELLRRGGLLHDVGKISIPDNILDKPGPLTPEEFEVIKQHPVLGVEIMNPLESLKDSIPFIRWHHERCDGKGYPDGISKRDIPFLVRVLSVADVYDALCSTRAYRPAMKHATAIEIMDKNAKDGGLDPDLVAQFTALPMQMIRDVLELQRSNHFVTSEDAMPIRKQLELSRELTRNC